MKRFFKILLVALLFIFILLQLMPRPVKNNDANVGANNILLTNMPPLEVQQILKNSCNDCHSNFTNYPWYSKIQPVAWWLGDHIKDGKRELNFSEFGSYSLRKQYRKLEEITKQVNEGEMPLTSYTNIHRNAILSTAEKKLLTSWANSEYDKMTKAYPADSLKRKR
ncbi:MAG: heme-binding domain-containing protein [Ferruginibacter sp.]